MKEADVATSILPVNMKQNNDLPSRHHNHTLISSLS